MSVATLTVKGYGNAANTRRYGVVQRVAEPEAHYSHMLRLWLYAEHVHYSQRLQQCRYHDGSEVLAMFKFHLASMLPSLSMTISSSLHWYVDSR